MSLTAVAKGACNPNLNQITHKKRLFSSSRCPCTVQTVLPHSCEATLPFGMIRKQRPKIPKRLLEGHAGVSEQTTSLC